MSRRANVDQNGEGRERQDEHGTSQGPKRAKMLEMSRDELMIKMQNAVEKGKFGQKSRFLQLFLKFKKVARTLRIERSMLIERFACLMKPAASFEVQTIYRQLHTAKYMAKRFKRRNVNSNAFHLCRF